MKHFFTKTQLQTIAATVFGFFFIIGAQSVLAGPVPPAGNTNHNVFGWAWSDGIGWISFNNCSYPLEAGTCERSNYGVNYNFDTTEISGYAWNDTVGWISFNNADINYCRQISGNSTLIGRPNILRDGAFARAINGTAVEGAWDGCIGITTAGGTVSFNEGNQIQLPNSYNAQGGVGIPFEGFAWGSTAIGWINFQPLENEAGVFAIAADLPVPEVTLTATPTLIAPGGSTTLTWSAQNATVCTPSWKSGTIPENGNETRSNIQQTTTFTVTCENPIGDSAQASVEVRVFRVATFTVQSAGACIDPNTNSITFNWSAPGAQNCTLRTPSGQEFVTSGSTGPQTVSGSATPGSYTLSCTANNGVQTLTANGSPLSVGYCAQEPVRRRRLPWVGER